MMVGREEGRQGEGGGRQGGAWNGCMIGNLSEAG